jgi:hypothetical protein
VDWNNDGKNDLLAGDTHGQVWLYLNTGSVTEPVLAEGVRIECEGHPIVGREVADASGKTLKPEPYMGYYSKIYWADITGDGLSDLLIGHTRGNEAPIVVYKNVGTADQPKLAKPEDLKLSSMSRPSPCVVDWDGDGTLDMVCGTEQPNLFFFKNTGTNAKPKWANAKAIKLTGDGIENGYRRRIAVTDWNEDGKLDLLVGDFYSAKRPIGGNLWLYLGK